MNCLLPMQSPPSHSLIEGLCTIKSSIPDNERWNNSELETLFLYDVFMFPYALHIVHK